MRRALLNLIRQDFEGEIEKKRNHEKIRKFFDMSEKQELTLDDQTWEDLDMDKVYEKLDRNYSSAGEEALYTMLRIPLMDEEKLRERGRFIELFRTDSKLRESLLYNFFKLGKDHRSAFLNMIKDDLVINRAKYYIYTIIGKVIPLIILLLTIFVNTNYIGALLLMGILNMMINSKEREVIKSEGILYLTRTIKIAKKISAIDHSGFNIYSEKISLLLKAIKDIDRGTRLINLINFWGGVLEPLSIVFLAEECVYYAISEKIRDKKKNLLELYYTLGEIEALISISGYQHNLKQTYSKPEFIEDVSLNITEGVHPLIEKPVPNTISIKNKGIVLTGTNMSGKSTFLRMLGVNILLSQTFYFVLAKGYKAPFFNIVTSISPKDDVTKGKSFYMAEVESVLRIISALENPVPVFCPIDELFRGTNPIERVSMAAEILRYINNGNTISIAATHDRELVEILGANYDFYYFSESVDSKTGLSFDYKIKKGASQTRNAIKLLEFMKYPQDIVDKAYKRAKSLEGVL